MIKALAVLALSLSMTACTTNSGLRLGRSIMEQGRTESALRQLLAESDKHPDDLVLRAYARQEAESWSGQVLRDAGAALWRGDFDTAEALYRQAQSWNRNSAEAADGLRRTQIARKHKAQLAEIGQMIEQNQPAALALLRTMLAEDPRNAMARRLRDGLEARETQDSLKDAQLAPAFKTPVTLNFIEQNLISLFELISRITGLNFIFDKDVPRGVNASLFVRDMRAEDAISLLLNAHQLEKKVLNENTILVYPDRPEKEKEYASLIVRSFYLSNADPAQVVALVKQVASPKLIHADARLNMVVVRDTPRAMEAIERLILAQDLPQSELLLEVEVLEVNSSDVLDLGLRYPPTIGFTPFSRPAGSTADLSYAANGQLTLADLSNLNKGSVLVSVGSPALSLNANQSRNHSKVLANPRIRVKNREKATITIGDRVPVITTTTNNGVTSENVNYLDVGLTLRVEPNLSLEDEIGIKVSLEVSNVVKTITTKNGLVAYQLGQRKADTVLTARDGETQVLAGLLSRNDGEESNAIPGIGSLPLLDRVFGSRKDVQSKTEVILLVTPRVVRNLALPPPHVMTFHSGTEARIGLKPPAAHAGKDAGGETAK